jgi:hypothetical protein
MNYYPVKEGGVKTTPQPSFLQFSQQVLLRHFHFSSLDPLRAVEIFRDKRTDLPFSLHLSHSFDSQLFADQSLYKSVVLSIQSGPLVTSGFL